MNEIVRWCRIDTPLGTVRIVARGDAIAGVWFDGQKYDAVPDAAWRESPVDPLLRDAARQLQEYFAGRRARFDLALAPQGTAFQQSVWREIAKVPAGRTASYGDLARRIGRPSAVRAVGAAVGRNPLSVIVPCHRIVGSDGSLTGYAGGLERKRALLALERVEVDAAHDAIAAGPAHSA
ncbi:MAG: methylated-DNA--[protein]-cysteine S-methyltransferase [Betaproteobacteria bacterium]|nr:methylated-DNA--[protein]-cysteine S-methyltransferase [Betaproteobacteria bacterium]